MLQKGAPKAMRIMGYTEFRTKTKTFWYRRVVPARLRGHVPAVAGFPENATRTEFNKNLKVSDKAAASRAASKIDLLVQEALIAAEARIKPLQGSLKPVSGSATPPDAQPLTLTPTLAFAALERWEEAEIKRSEIDAFNSEPRIDVSESAMIRSRTVYELGNRNGANWWARIEGFDEKLIGVLSAAGVAVNPAHPAIGRLRLNFADRWARVMRAQDLMQMGRWEWSDPSETPNVPTSSVAPITIARDESLQALTLEEVLASYLREAESTSRISPKSRTEFERVFKMLIGFFGSERLASEVRAGAVRKFRDFVLTLPARQQKADIGLTAREVAARYATRPDHPKKSWKTAAKYLDFLSAIFGHGLALEAINANPVTGAKFRTGRRAREQSRVEFSDDDLEKIVSSPLFMGCAGVTRHHKHGDKVLWGARYWCMLLGVTTGARINEIGQLLVTDIRSSIEKIPFLSINVEIDESHESEEFGKTIKNSNSIRNLPIHPRIIDLGFLEYQKEIANRGERFLFPELQHQMDGIETTKELSRWYGRYFGRIGINDTRKVYHSFRHWIVARLGANAPDYLRRRITGHAAGSEGDRYGGRAAMPDILAALNTLPLAFVDHLKKPTVVRYEVDHLKPRRIRSASNG